MYLFIHKVDNIILNNLKELLYITSTVEVNKGAFLRIKIVDNKKKCAELSQLLFTQIKIERLTFALLTTYESFDVQLITNSHGLILDKNIASQFNYIDCSLLGVVPLKNDIVEIYKFAEGRGLKTLERSYLIDKIEYFLYSNPPNRKMLLLEGDSGTGKTQLIKTLSNRYKNSQTFNIKNTHDTKWFENTISTYSISELPSPELTATKVVKKLIRNNIKLCIFEDIHWCDDISFRILDKILWLAPSNLKLIFTTRPHEESKFDKCKNIYNIKTIFIPNLTYEEIKEFIEININNADSSYLTKNICKLTNGNIFYVTQIIEYFKRNHQLNPKYTLEILHTDNDFLHYFQKILAEQFSTVEESTIFTLELLSLLNRPLSVGKYNLIFKNSTKIKSLIFSKIVVVENNEIAFKHDIIKLTISKSTKLVNTEDVIDFVDSLIYYQNFKDAVDVQEKLNRKVLNYEYSLFEACKSSFDDNSLSEIFHYTEIALANKNLLSKERLKYYYLYRGLANAAIGQLDLAYPDLNQSLIKFNIKMGTISAFMSIINCLIRPHITINRKNKHFNDTDTKHQQLIISAIRYLIEYTWITRQNTKCLCNCVSYSTIQQSDHSIYSGESQLLLGLCSYTVMKTRGQIFINSRNQELSNCATKENIYSKYLLIHHNLGGKQWYYERSSIDAILNSENDEHFNLKGKISLGLFYIDYCLGNYSRAKKTLVKYAKLMRFYKQNWLLDLLNLCKSCLEYILGNYHKSHFMMNSISSIHLKKDSTFQLYSSVIDLDNDYEKSKLHFQCGVKMLYKNKFKEYSRSLFTIEAIILSYIFYPIKPITPNNKYLKLIIKYTKQHNHFFHSFYPVAAFIKYTTSFFLKQENNYRYYENRLKGMNFVHHLNFFTLFQDIVILQNIETNNGEAGQRKLILTLNRKLNHG